MAAVEATVGVDADGTEEEREEDASNAVEGEATAATFAEDTNPAVDAAATATKGVTEQGAEGTCSTLSAATGLVVSASAVKIEGEAKETMERGEAVFAAAATAAVCGLPLPAATCTQEVPARRTVERRGAVGIRPAKLASSCSYSVTVSEGAQLAEQQRRTAMHREPMQPAACPQAMAVVER